MPAGIAQGGDTAPPVGQPRLSSVSPNFIIMIAISQQPEYLTALLAHCQRRRYPKGMQIIQGGDPAETLFFIVRGSVKISMEDDGREIILSYLNQGEFFGEMGLFAPTRRRSVSVFTRTECEIAHIGYQHLEQLLDAALREHTKSILFAISRQLTQRLMKTSLKVGHLAFLDVTGRIARALLDLAGQPDAMTHPDGMQIRISRQEIGRIVGCSREMAGRVLKNLEDQHLIEVQGMAIVVLGVGPRFQNQQSPLSRIDEGDD